MQVWPNCQKSDHHESQVIGFCCNPHCKSKQKLLCFYCLKQTTHDDHKNDIIERNRVKEWQEKQKNDLYEVINILREWTEQITKPLKSLQQQIESQIFTLFDQDQKEISYMDLNEKVKNIALSKLLSDRFFTKQISQIFQKFCLISQSLCEQIKQQNLNLSTFQKKVYLIIDHNGNPQDQNNINRNQQRNNSNIFDFFQTENNLSDLNTNQNQEMVQDKTQSSIQTLTQIFYQNQTQQINYLIDVTLDDGIDQLNSGNLQKAKLIFETLQKQKASSEIILWLVYSHICLGNQKEALSILVKFLNQNENKQCSHAWYLATLITIEMRNFKIALYCVKKFLILRPQSSKGWIKAGYILVQLCEYDLALQFLQQVIKYEQNNLEAKGNLCLNYLKQGLNKLAEKEFREIEQINPKYEYLNFLQPYLKC